MNRTICVCLVLAGPLLAQDARQIVEEIQRRGKVNSQRYEGVLEVTAADGKVTRKVLAVLAPRCVRQQQAGDPF